MLFHFSWFLCLSVDSKYFMLLGEINLLFLIVFILVLSFISNVGTALHLLLTAEFIWVSLYAIALLVGWLYNCLNIITLTFFFLILSAIEFGLGLIIVLFKHVFTRSITFYSYPLNSSKFLLRFTQNANTSQFRYV